MKCNWHELIKYWLLISVNLRVNKLVKNLYLKKLGDNIRKTSKLLGIKAEYPVH